jgi:heme/copper-type cytochrome/quinol oxidase subunit 1
LFSNSSFYNYFYSSNKKNDFLFESVIIQKNIFIWDNSFDLKGFDYQKFLVSLVNWTYTTFHKKVRIWYFFLSFWIGLVGLSLRIIIRFSLIKVGFYNNGQLYNSILTQHALVIIFFIVIPAILGGFGNWFIPILINRDDLIYPRLNSLRFWFLFSSLFFLLIRSFFNRGVGTSWTLYPPLRTEGHGGFTVILRIFRLHLAGISSILGRINFIVTIKKVKLNFINIICVSLFIWSLFVTTFLLILSLPVLARCLTILITDKLFNTSFFNILGGGNPFIFQHLFWFFGHPEVYILILPAFGIIRYSVVLLRGKTKTFGIIGIFFAIFRIGLVGCLVWAHHIYVIGIDIDSRIYYITATIIIAIPTGIKVYSWLLTLKNVIYNFDLLIIWIFGFIFIFTVGGLTGLILSNCILDNLLHDTYYVVAHFHYVLRIGAVFGIFSGICLWWEEFFIVTYNKIIILVFFRLFFIGVNLIFFPIHFIGLQGLPRKYFSYDDNFIFINLLISLGFFLTLIRIFVFLFIFIYSILLIKLQIFFINNKNILNRQISLTLFVYHFILKRVFILKIKGFMISFKKILFVK